MLKSIRNQAKIVTIQVYKLWNFNLDFQNAPLVTFNEDA